MIIYNVKHNYIEIAENEMKSHLDNRKLKATIYQEETISPFRKKLTANKIGVVSFIDTNEEINPAHWTDQIENEFLNLLIANVRISIHQQQYIDGNKGLNFDSETINQLSKLNLGIDIDQYVYGKELKPVL